MGGAMNHFILNKSWIDAILGLVMLEGLLLVAWRTRNGRGPKPGPLVANLLAGGFILLALRAAISGGSLVWIAVCLAMSLIAHLVDLVSRWESPEPIQTMPDARVTRAMNSPCATKIPQAPSAPNVESNHA